MHVVISRLLPIVIDSLIPVVQAYMSQMKPIPGTVIVILIPLLVVQHT